MASGKRPSFLGIFGLLLVACGHPLPPPEARAPEPAPERPKQEPAKLAQSIQSAGRERPEARERRLDQEAMAASRLQINSMAPTADTLELFIMEHGPAEPWVAVLVNRTPRSYQVDATPARLSLSVQVPGKKDAVLCTPPKSESAGNSSANQRVELESGAALLYRFDVRWLCFRETPDNPLLPGAIVEAHFGWPTLKKTRWAKGKREEYTPEQKAPFVAQGIIKTDGNDPSPSEKSEKPTAPATTEKPKKKKSGVGPSAPDPYAIKEILSAGLALSQDYAEPVKADDSKLPLELSLPRGSDAADAAHVIVDVGLKNRSADPQKLFFRRELLTFNILGESGSVRCQPEPDDRAPDRNAFMTLRPGQFMSVPNRMIELCPAGAFSEPGLYQVTASLTATDSGKELGLAAFTGTLKAVNAIRVRILRNNTDPARLMSKFSLNAAAPTAQP